MRFILPLLFGIAGVAVLISLGVWQVQRLAWKQEILAEIEAKIAAEPVALPESPDAEADKYLPVEMTGRFQPGLLRVLVSQKHVGAGYRIISPFETEAGRLLLLDRGFIKIDGEMRAPPTGPVEVTGNLHWPDDRNSSTPENDLAENMWFARDIGQMAEVFGTEPLLVVVREMSPGDTGATPLPVDTSGIPNDHLEYAITWFSLAVLWAAMTGLLIWRMRQPAKGAET